MPWYVYLAFKQLFPTGRRVSFFTVISVLGVAAGVWLLVAITGVMGGFGEKYRAMIVDTQGEIQVRGYGAISQVAEVQKKLKAVPGVTGVTAYAQGIVMLQYDNRPAFPGIQGIDLNHVEEVVPMRKYVSFGSLDDLDDDTVILSVGLAREIGVGVGSRVQLYSPLTLEKIKTDEVLLPVELKVVGIFEIGHQQLDSSTAIVTLRRMQDLYGLGGDVHGFNMKLKPGSDVVDASLRVNAAIDQNKMTAKTWMEANEAFLFALQLEKMMVTLITSFVVLIAMFLVTALLLIAVVRKTREIGILGALGGLPRQTAACFCFQGFFVGTFGTVLGLLGGWLTLKYIDQIFHTLGAITGSWDNMVAIYQFSQVPAYITPLEVVGISLYAILMATLAGLIAAWRAARLQPVEALRSE